MSLRIGDVVWAIGGDLGGFDSALKQSERLADRTGESIGSKLRKALSPQSLMSDIGTGFKLGAGIAGFNALAGSIQNVSNTIPDLLARGESFGLLVDDIADKTGASAENASLLAGSLTALGIPTEGLGSNLRILSQQVVNNEALFREHGIRVRDNNGVLLDTVTILDNVRRSLSGEADGAAKAELAQRLLGRSALELIDYLNLTDAQAAALGDQLKKMGLIVGEEFRAEAEKAKRETSLLDLAWTGLGVTLQAEVSPIIRAVIGGLTNFITEHLADVKKIAAEAAAAIAGIVSGLTGIEIGSTFVDQLTALGGAPATATSQLRDRLGELNAEKKNLIDSEPKATAAAGANTAALDRQTAAVERQIGTLQRKEAAEERAYEREAAGLAAVWQRELDLMDLEDRRRAQAKTDADLQTALVAAQEALWKAQHPAAGTKFDPAAELAARKDVAAAGAAIAENERTKTEAERRRQTENTKSYIEGVAQLVANAENRKALATTLARRQTALEGQLASAKARGDAEEVARVEARLEAVKTAETRNQAAMRNASRIDELTKTKNQLEELRKSITSSIGGGSTQAHKEWKTNVDKIDTEIGQTRAALASLYASERHYGPSGGVPPLGSGGGLAKALDETTKKWKERAEEWSAALVGEDGKGGVLGALQDIAGEIAGLFALQPPAWFTTLAGMTAGGIAAGPVGAAVGAGVGAETGAIIDARTKADADYYGRIVPAYRKAMLAGPLTRAEIVALLRELGVTERAIAAYVDRLMRGDLSGKAYASGGIIPPGGWGWTGEAGLERTYSLPGGGTLIEPVAAAAGSGGRPWVTALSGIFSPPRLAAASLAGGGAAAVPVGGGDPIVIHNHIRLGEHEFAVAISEVLSLLPRH